MMNRVSQIKTIPENSIILKDFGKTDYLDVYQIRKQTNESVDSITTQIFSLPLWVNGLLKIRNSIVGKLGLKTESKKDTTVDVYYPTGSKAVFFTVIDRNENEIVMAENDKHLNFRTSVYIDRNDTNTDIYLSTLVKFNNTWGKLYFLPVKPFHKLIIKSLLKSL